MLSIESSVSGRLIIYWWPERRIVKTAKMVKMVKIQRFKEFICWMSEPYGKGFNFDFSRWFRRGLVQSPVPSVSVLVRLVHGECSSAPLERSDWKESRARTPSAHQSQSKSVPQFSVFRHFEDVFGDISEAFTQLFVSFVFGSFVFSPFLCLFSLSTLFFPPILSSWFVWKFALSHSLSLFLSLSLSGLFLESLVFGWTSFVT